MSDDYGDFYTDAVDERPPAPMVLEGKSGGRGRLRNCLILVLLAAILVISAYGAYMYKIRSESQHPYDLRDYLVHVKDRANMYKWGHITQEDYEREGEGVPDLP